MSHNNSTSYKPGQTYNLYHVRETHYTGMEEDDSRTCESKTYFEIIDASQDDFQSNLHGNEDYNLRYNTSLILKDLTQRDITKLGKAISNSTCITFVPSKYDETEDYPENNYQRSTAHEAIDADYGP